MPAISFATTSPEAELARNPETTADVLKAIYEPKQAYKNKHTQVMAALAQNPNTPVDILSDLIFDYTPAFCLNPIAPLVLLEKPHFLTRMNDAWQHKFLQCAEAPAPLVRSLLHAKTATVVSEARHHISLDREFEPGEWQTELQAVCQSTPKKPSPDEKQFHSDYAELGFLPAWPRFAAPVPKPNDKTLSKDLNGAQWQDAGGRVLMQMFSPDISPEVFRKLNKETHSTVVQIALAVCPQTPADVLMEIAAKDYSDERVRLLCARHANAPADLLTLFASDKNPVLRRLVRRHPNAPEAVQSLCQYAAASKKGSTPLWFLVNGLHGKPPLKDLRTRIQSPYWMVRLSVVFAVSNGSTRLNDERREMLKYLSRDANRFVRAAAKTCLADENYRFAW